MMLLATTVALALSAATATGDFVPRTVEAEAKGTASASLNGLTNPALVGFRLRYMNGDHELNSIAVKPSSGDVLAILRDQNHDDDMSMRVTYGGWDFYRSYDVTAKCRGACTIPIVDPPSALAGTKRLVLVGFDVLVQNPSDRDRRVRVLSIRPSADEQSFRAEFRDNGTFDYSVNIRYAWIASGHSGKLSDTATRTAAQRTQQVEIGQPLASQDAAEFIAGFSVEFTNGEHNLRDIAFEKSATGQYSVRFNDANYDDPMTATLDRVWIR
ncbi:MAG TPA: hypothetical protein VG755_10385 [Nannocystaceae bacterium]|nr:hypothetical protein [Nannocystaceae bacterium]